MNSTKLKGVVVNRDKGKIIKGYKDGIEIHVLADEYNIEVDTLCRRLKKWGVKIRKGDYKRRIQKQERPKRKYSPELLAQRAINQKTNNKHIHYISFESQKTRDARLIHNILIKAYL